MGKKAIALIILIILTIIPSMALADGIKSIVIVVDQMSMDMVEELASDNSSIGFINLKTRSKYSEENLYLSINTGRKLGKKDLEKELNIEFLGDSLKKEKLSYIGVGKENHILSDSKGKVDYEERSIEYNLDWLVKNTDTMLEKSNILAIGYEFDNQLARVETLKEYLKHYDEDQIIILPKSTSEDNNILNKYLVPVIYKSKENSGLLTSSSTKRTGFIAMEDISVQLKNTYGHFNKTDIGNSFNIMEKQDPIREINKIHKNTMNLLILTYIFHGLTYLCQIVLGVGLLKSNKISRKMYFPYIFLAVSICVSFILGLLGVHNHIIIYLFAISLVSYGLSKLIIDGKDSLVSRLIVLTYGLIVIGSLFYPEMTYNSYIGFNNLAYGARYYGLNNGIMGVLLASSILSFFSLTEKMDDTWLKKCIGFCIFGLNMIVLSTNFGANTGGFITSIVLFVLAMYILLFSQKHSLKKVIIFCLIGLGLFVFNMIIDNKSGGKSHAIEFFYRLKENGFMEFFYMSSFKLRELVIWTLTPPFSLVLIFQGIILKKLSEFFSHNGKIKKEAIVIAITSLVGFFINDTGMIMLIYMINYYILYIINRGGYME